MRIVVDLMPARPDAAPPSPPDRLAVDLAVRLACAARRGVDVRIAVEVSDAATALARRLPPAAIRLRPDASALLAGLGPARAPLRDCLHRLHLASLQPNVIVFLGPREDVARGRAAQLAPPGVASLLVIHGIAEGNGPVLRLRRLTADRDGPAADAVIGAAGADGGGAALLDAIERLVRLEAVQPVGIVRRPAPTYGIEAALEDAARILGASGQTAPAGRVVDALIDAARPVTALGPPRLLIDTSTTAHRDAGTGIQRVVKETVAALARLHADLPMDRAPTAVKLGPFDDLVPSGLGAAGPGRAPEAAVGARAGDILLLLDSTWSDVGRFDPAIDATRRAGGSVIGVVYDLVPYLHPEFCDPAMPTLYDAWLRWMLVRADGVACISRAVAGELAAWIDAHRLPYRDGLRIGWWHLGSDIAAAVGSGTLGREMRAAFEGGDRPFLMVGTIEPRKRHDVVLDAFEALWAGGSDARLVLMGKAGWRTADFAARLWRHPELGGRLFWIAQASDADVAAAYARSRALVFASIYEGYGLPMVEAVRAGLPVIAADIPVLREVGGIGASYFGADDPADLARLVRAVLDGAELPDPRSMRALTWRESAEGLLDVILGDDWYAAPGWQSGRDPVGPPDARSSTGLEDP